MPGGSPLIQSVKLWVLVGRIQILKGHKIAGPKQWKQSTTCYIAIEITTRRHLNIRDPLHPLLKGVRLIKTVRVKRDAWPGNPDGYILVSVSVTPIDSEIRSEGPAVGEISLTT
jgi:hypothetical protein